MAQSIHAGRLAIAFSVPQFQELEQYCYSTENLYNGISWTMGNKLQVSKILKLGRSYFNDQFAADIVVARRNDELAKFIDRCGTA